MASRRSELIRVLGLGFGLAVTIGGVVGQGILRTPGIVAGAVPDPGLILLLWTAGGLLAATTAVALVELASALPRAGGPYVFVGRALGTFPGIVIGWTDLTVNVVAAAYFAVVLAEYLQRLGWLGEVPIAAAAAALIALFTATNWAGTRSSGFGQTVGTLVKGLGLLAMLTALFALAPDRAGAGATPSDATAPTFAAFAIALRAIQNTYSGWNMPAYFGEEIQDPGRNVARSVFGGLAAITVLYVLVNAALLHVLTPAEIAASKLPAADAMARVLGPGADVAVNVLALVSVAAIANLYPMSVSRIAYSMARQGTLPPLLARVSASGTPRAALAATSAVAVLLATTGTYEQLLAIAAPVTIVVDVSVILAALRLRRTEPDLPRPYRMPLYPLPALLALALNLALLVAVVYEDPVYSLLGVGLVAAISLAQKAVGGVPRAAA